MPKQHLPMVHHLVLEIVAATAQNTTLKTVFYEAFGTNKSIGWSKSVVLGGIRKVYRWFSSNKRSIFLVICPLALSIMIL